MLDESLCISFATKGASCDGRNKQECIERTIASYTKKQGKARMASDGNICGDSPRSPEEPPNADDDEFLDDRNEEELSCATSASLFRLRLYIKRNVGSEF